ncbi:MAG: division/cell wall cluster transcriptional repressor MraZ [Cyclobacteriaceae bacterium]|nr:division/cell wall cluster transcriptional repressor MraZ [Cyclobacteriaceae bacterium]
MSLFTGEYECKLDTKGRLVLPARIKSRLPDVSGNQLVLSLGLEPCLVLYPLIEYRKISSRVASMNEFSEELRHLQRNFFRRIAEIELDSAGRLLIPKTMAKYASLEKDIMLVGMGNRVELWNTQAYERYIINDTAEFSKLAQKHLTD